MVHGLSSSWQEGCGAEAQIMAVGHVWKVVHIMVDQEVE